MKIDTHKHTHAKKNTSLFTLVKDKIKCLVLFCLELIEL